MIVEHSKIITARHIEDNSKTEKLIMPKVFIEFIIINGTSKILTISA